MTSIYVEADKKVWIESRTWDELNASATKQKLDTAPKQLVKAFGAPNPAQAGRSTVDEFAEDLRELADN